MALPATLKPFQPKHPSKSQGTEVISVQCTVPKKRSLSRELTIKCSPILVRDWRELTLMWLWVWETLRVSWAIRCKKGVPRGTTLNAEFKVPISNCDSLRVVDFQHLKEARAAWVRLTLSGGSLASIFTESRIMPMNSKTLSGPWVLLVATWIPRFLNARSMDPLDSIRQHIEEKGTTSNKLSWST